MTSIRKRLESESLTIDLIKWFYASYGNVPLCCNVSKGNKIKCDSVKGFLSSESFKIECVKCQNYIKTQLYKRLFDYSEITFKGFYAHNKQIHAKSFVTDKENILALNYNEALKEYYSNICLHEIVEISIFRTIEQINDSLAYNEHVSNLTHYLTCLSLNQYLTIPLKPLTKYATHDFLAFDFKPSENSYKEDLWNKALKIIKSQNSNSDSPFKILKAYVFGSYSVRDKPNDIDIIAFIDKNISFGKCFKGIHFIFLPFKPYELKTLLYYVKESKKRYGDKFKLLCIYNFTKEGEI